MTTPLTYVVVSPVKDEERFVARTIHSVLNQTVLPFRWIIVDDGSTDNTPEIVAAMTAGIDWIQFIRTDRQGKRELGITEIRAFYVGYDLIRDVDYDFVVKLDCDVELQSGYFEKMIERFVTNPGLGIASGAFLEYHEDRWVFIRMPDYHASGASKMMRAECFRQIGGFIQRKGWDTVDEIKARALGWKTERFHDLTFLHLKREGSASGYVYSNLLEGEVDYVTGSSLPFVMLKALRKIVRQRPLILAGSIGFWGFFRPWITGRPKLVTNEEAKSYRALLHGRIRSRVLQLLGMQVPRTE